MVQHWSQRRHNRQNFGKSRGSKRMLWMITIWFVLGLLFADLMEFRAMVRETSTPPEHIFETPTNAIIVLTGDTMRLESGFELLSQSRAEKLFISGVHPDTKLDDLMHRWDGPDRDKWQSCCIDLGYTARNTKENAKESHEWMTQNNFKSAFLITSDYHMARALSEFQYYAPEIEIKPYPVKSENVTQTHLWRLLFNEYIAMQTGTLRRKLGL